jgi:hypothetical protein
MRLLGEKGDVCGARAAGFMQQRFAWRLLSVTEMRRMSFQDVQSLISSKHRTLDRHWLCVLVPSACTIPSSNVLVGTAARRPAAMITEPCARPGQAGQAGRCHRTNQARPNPLHLFFSLSCPARLYSNTRSLATRLVCLSSSLSLCHIALQSRLRPSCTREAAMFCLRSWIPVLFFL